MERPSDSNSPFYGVYLELKHTSTVKTHWVTFHMEMAQVVCRVFKKDGSEVPRLRSANYPDQTYKTYWSPIPLTYLGTSRLQIDFSMMPVRQGEVGLLDIGPGDCWLIPQQSGPIFLEITFVLTREEAEKPTDWLGTLKLPPVEIPKWR